MTEHLLDALAKKLGCCYLSDLRGCAYRDRAVKLALELLPRYPRGQWPEVASYLLDTAAGTPDTAQALLEQAAHR